MTDGSAVVVSGASAGIGAATVELLARKGYVAFAGVRTATDAARLAAVHSNVRPIMLDVGDRDSIERAVREIVASGTPVIGVVSNAGIARAGPLEHLPIDVLRRQIFATLESRRAPLPRCDGNGHVGERVRGAFGDAGRAGRPGDRTRALVGQAASALPAGRTGSHGESACVVAGRAARPRDARVDAPSLAERTFGPTSRPRARGYWSRL